MPTEVPRFLGCRIINIYALADVLSVGHAPTWVSVVNQRSSYEGGIDSVAQQATGEHFESWGTASGYGPREIAE